MGKNIKKKMMISPGVVDCGYCPEFLDWGYRPADSGMLVFSPGVVRIVIPGSWLLRVLVIALGSWIESIALRYGELLVIALRKEKPAARGMSTGNPARKEKKKGPPPGQKSRRKNF